jgi:hypothetical protein
MIRSSKMTSLRTQALLATTRNDSPFSRAAPVKVLSIRLRIWAIGRSVMLVESTPASSLEISRSALNSSFMAATAASIRSTSRLPSAVFI